MSTEILKTAKILDELLEVFFHKFIYYIPNEVVSEAIKDQLKGHIEDDFFDQFHFIDNKLGSAVFTNDDALEVNTYLNGKTSFLEQNTFKLVAKSNELTEFEFLVILDKYYLYLHLFINITDWLSCNLKKYNGEDVHISIVGAFYIQLQYFVTHLNDIENYFERYLDLEKEINFTVGDFVLQYLPDIISRYTKIQDAQGVEKTTQTSEEKATTKDNVDSKIPAPKTKSKKQQPQLDDKQVEAMILSKVFNVKEVSKI